MFNGLNQGFYDFGHQTVQLYDDSYYETDEFRMYGFKIKWCPKMRSHDWTMCPFAHRGERARRRDPRKYNYVPISCPDYKVNGECRRGDFCHFAHGIFEYWLHPAKYRTNPCNAGCFCQRKVCFFAHTVGQLRGESKAEWVQSFRARKELLVNGSGLGVVSGPSTPPPVVEGFDENSEIVEKMSLLNVEQNNDERVASFGLNIPESDYPDFGWVTELVDEM